MTIKCKWWPMLIEFRVTNFRSFREEQVFSMAAGNLKEHAESNTFLSGLKGFGAFLRSSAIYGPNAAGKTNLLLALRFMQQLVLASAAKDSTAPNPYTPHKFSSETRDAPSEFQITFAEQNMRYEYGFFISRTRIEKEWLIEYVNPRGRLMFQRDYNTRQSKYEWKFSSFFKGQRALWSDATRPDALFLSTAIQLNSTQLLPVFEWFQKRLVVRAVQRFILSLFSNMVQGSEGANEKEDSQEDFSLNLCLATASTGGRHEVIRTFSFAARNDPRPTPRRGQTL